MFQNYSTPLKVILIFCITKDLYTYFAIQYFCCELLCSKRTLPLDILARKTGKTEKKVLN